MTNRYWDNSFQDSRVLMDACRALGWSPERALAAAGVLVAAYGRAAMAANEKSPEGGA